MPDQHEELDVALPDGSSVLLQMNRNRALPTRAAAVHAGDEAVSGWVTIGDDQRARQRRTVH